MFGMLAKVGISFFSPVKIWVLVAGDNNCHYLWLSVLLHAAASTRCFCFAAAATLCAATFCAATFCGLSYRMILSDVFRIAASRFDDLAAAAEQHLRFPPRPPRSFRRPRFPPIFNVNSNITLNGR